MEKEQVLNELKKIFEQEKWSKFQLSEYNLKKFQELDSFIEKIKENNLQKEAIKLFKEYLEKNEYNIIARYLLAYFSFPEDKNTFYENFKRIINNFKEREKWSIVEFLSEKMLSFEENEFALLSLIDSLKFLNKPKRITELQEKYLELNPSDTTVALNLARKKEKEGDIKSAVKYYKIAIKTFISQKNQKQVEDIWEKLLSLSGDDLKWMDELNNLLKANFSFASIANLYKIIIPGLIKKENYDKAIEILKEILHLIPDNKEFREELIKIYRLKYKDHSKLEDILKSSGLRMWWKDVINAIDLFEKEIKFDIGTYVYHHSWGAGKIVKIEKDSMIIDFEEDSEHKMSVEMALNTLEILDENHIKVKKRYEKENILEILEKEPIKFIEMVFQSYKTNEINIEILKNEVTDKLLKSSEWQRWWNKAKRELKTNSNFKLLESDKVIRYVESDTSFGDIILENFKRSRDFFEKINIINELIANDVNKKVSKDIYQEITDWFIEFVKDNITNKPELSYIAYIVIKKIKEFYNEISIENLNIDAKYIIENAKNLIDLFKRVDLIEYQKMLVEDIVANKEKWEDILYEIMLTENSKIFDYITDIFSSQGKDNKIKEVIESGIKNYRKYPELFIWISKNILNGEFDKYLEDKRNTLKMVFQNLLFLLSYLGRQIKNKNNVTFNKKLQQQIVRLLFDKKSNFLLNYIKDAISQQEDTSAFLNLIRENEYIPKKQKENIIAEVRNSENTIIY